jgi:hypothetical protein
VTTSWGDAEAASANAQFGEAFASNLCSSLGELAWACTVIAMNKPTAMTSTNNMPKRFKVMYRMEPPRFQLVCEWQQEDIPTHCDKSHINSIPENAYSEIKSRPDLIPDAHLSFC